MLSRLPKFIRAPRAAIILVWLLFNLWFIRNEVMPGGAFGAPAGYDAVIDSGLMHRDSWMRILDGDRVIGYSNTRIDVDEFSPGGRYLLLNETAANLSILGGEYLTTIKSRIVLDMELQLEEFDFEIDSADHRMRLTGNRMADRVFRIQFRGPVNLPPTRITLPGDAMILPPTAEIGLRNMRPGRKTTLQLFDPLTMQTAPMTVEALRREPFEHLGRVQPATVLAMQYHGVTLHSWIDDQGNVLRQETPLGWIMEQCEPEDAMNFLQP